MGNFLSILLVAGAFAFSILYYGGSEDVVPEFEVPGPKKSSIKTAAPENAPETSRPETPKVIPMADRPRVILFTGTSWCPACVYLQKQVLSTPEWRTFSSSEIRFQVYNVASSSSRRTTAINDAIKKYGVRAFPTMVVVSKDGKKLTSIRGAKSSTDAYRSVIMKYVGR